MLFRSRQRKKLSVTPGDDDNSIRREQVLSSGNVREYETKNGEVEVFLVEVNDDKYYTPGLIVTTPNDQTLDDNEKHLNSFIPVSQVPFPDDEIPLSFHIRIHEGSTVADKDINNEELDTSSLGTELKWVDSHNHVNNGDYGITWHDDGARDYSPPPGLQLDTYLQTQGTHVVDDCTSSLSSLSNGSDISCQGIFRCA